MTLAHSSRLFCCSMMLLCGWASSGLGQNTTELQYGSFVDRQYYDFLGREAEEGGYNIYLDLLGSGTVTPEQVVAYFILSPEFNDQLGFISCCYFGLFNNNSAIDYTTPDYRLPDYGGMAYWQGVMKDVFALGGSLNDAKQYVIEGFAGSPEWQARIGDLLVNVNITYATEVTETTETVIARYAQKVMCLRCFCALGDLCGIKTGG